MAILTHEWYSMFFWKWKTKLWYFYDCSWWKWKIKTISISQSRHVIMRWSCSHCCHCWQCWLWERGEWWQQCWLWRELAEYWSSTRLTQHFIPTLNKYNSTHQNKLKHTHFINWFLELSDPPADYVYQLSKFNFTSIFKCFRLFEHENGPNWWFELMQTHLDCLCSLKCSKIMDWSQENHWSEAGQSWESVR